MSSIADRLRATLIRNLDAAAMSRELRPPLYDSQCARLARGTAAQRLGISVDIVEPGMRACPYHFHHAQEEAFVILEGEGSLRVAGEMLSIAAGDVIFIPAGPQYPHQIINTSDAPLKFLSIGTTDTPELVEYPDSGKALTLSHRHAGVQGFARMHREKDALDYWDGEP